MLNVIKNMLSPFTTRSTSEDRSPEEAETVSSDCWRGARTLSRHTASDRTFARGQTMELEELGYGRSLAQRTVRVSGETALSVAKDECTGEIPLTRKEIPLTRKMTLKLMLNPPPGVDIIGLDVVESEGRCSLVEGSKFQVYYLGESESGRNSIDVPFTFNPKTGAPCYFLTPPLHGDVVSVEIIGDRIKAFRKSEREMATAENESSASELIGPQGSSPSQFHFRDNKSASTSDAMPALFSVKEHVQVLWLDIPSAAGASDAQR